MARLGFGLVQVPRDRVAGDLAAAEPVEVLADYPPPDSPVHLLHPEGRQLSPRVRISIDWATAEFGAKLSAA